MPALPSWETPTAYFNARSSITIKAVYAERWQALLPSSELALVDAAGHMVPYEQTEAVLEATRKFLGRAG